MEIFGIMGAMPDEVEQLCQKLRDVSVESYGGVEYHRGFLDDKEAVVCCAGMGKANAAAATQVLITRFGAEKIIFSGIAGNMTSKIGIGDVVIGKTVVYHDAEDSMICQSAPFLKEYRARCVNLGRKVRFEGGEGIAETIDDQGRLVVRTADGEARVFTGEVSVQGVYGAED